VRLASVLAMGTLYVMARTSGISSLADLAGQRFVMPYRNDMPDLILRHIARHQGLDPDKDFAIQYVGTPLAAVQLLLSGRADAAVWPRRCGCLAGTCGNGRDDAGDARWRFDEARFESSGALGRGDGWSRPFSLRRGRFT